MLYINIMVIIINELYLILNIDHIL